MERRIKNEIKDWLRIIGWMLFIVSFLYIIIKIKTVD